MAKVINKIAVPAMGETANDLISSSFGRCLFMIIYEVESESFTAFVNPGASLPDGSGLKASEIIIRNKADSLLTIELGRKAYSVLTKEHINVHLLKSSGAVKSAINKFIKKWKHDIAGK